MDKQNTEISEFIFTGGCNQELEGYYIRIKAPNYWAARDKMTSYFGDNWAFQYTLEDWKKWEEKAHEIGMPIEKELYCLE